MKKFRTIAIWVQLLGVAGLLYYFFRDAEWHPEKFQAAFTVPTKPCSTDWRLCADNSDMANNYRDWTMVKASCEVEAEQRASYGKPQWPEWPMPHFGSFYTGDSYVKKGVAYVIERNAKFQNGFGAWARVEVVCAYDLNAQKVISVSVQR